MTEKMLVKEKLERMAVLLEIGGYLGWSKSISSGVAP